MTTDRIPDAGQLIWPDLDILLPSPTNPRKHFDPAGLRELADSIAVDGVMQPIVVRPIPAELRTAHPGKELEIVAGERRFRASVLAGLASIPAMLRHLDNKQTVRIQVIENLQREGLNPIEEAMGFASLRESGMSADVIGEQIGKSRRYVYGKLKLLDLSAPVVEALQQGRIVENVALLIASIPLPELQAAALKGVASSDEYPSEAMSFRQAKAYIANRFTKNLSRVAFDLRDATLHPTAGACTDCPNRLGNQPDTDPTNANVCTAPPCAELKREAHDVRTLGLPDDTPRVEVAKISGSGACNWTDYDAAGFRRLDSKKTNDPAGRTYAEWLREIGASPQAYVHFDAAASEARALVAKADLIAIAARAEEPPTPAPTPAPEPAADVMQGAYTHPGGSDDYTLAQRAKTIIAAAGHVSAAGVQQALSIAYADALRIFEILTLDGYLSKTQHGNSVAYSIAAPEADPTPEPTPAPTPAPAAEPAAAQATEQARPSSDYLYALARACKSSPPMMIVWPFTRIIAQHIAAKAGGLVPDDASEADCIDAIVHFIAHDARTANPARLIDLARALNIDPDTIGTPPTKHTTPARYRHPEHHDMEWTGHGRKPQWVLEWLAAGGSVEDLKIEATEAGG